MIITLLLANIKTIGLAIGAFFGAYVLHKNKSLTDENENLSLASFQKDKIIEIQQKVLDATQNIKSVSLDDNIARMQDKSDPL